MAINGQDIWNMKNHTNSVAKNGKLSQSLWTSLSKNNETIKEMQENENRNLVWIFET